MDGTELQKRSPFSARAVSKLGVAVLVAAFILLVSSIKTKVAVNGCRTASQVSQSSVQLYKRGSNTFPSLHSQLQYGASRERQLALPQRKVRYSVRVSCVLYFAFSLQIQSVFVVRQPQSYNTCTER